MTIAIIGLGLIGGSFAKDLRHAPFEPRLIGVESNPAHAARAAQLGLVDAVLPLSEAMRQADVLILAVPVDAILALLPRILDAIGPKQTAIDLGSAKSAIAAAVKSHPNRSRYVAAHPMAGTENSGPDAALDGIFRGKTVLLCDLDSSAPDACEAALSIFHAVGLRFEFMTSGQHDRHAAYVSHLSHVAAYALSLAVQSEEKAGYAIPRLAGGGFASTVRLAKSSPEMWTPIFRQNRGPILQAIDAYMNELAALRSAIASDDRPDELPRLIREANRIRDLL